MNELQRLITRRIRATGPLTVADYMAEALFHPGYGYYVTHDPLGAHGDFVTAPEISQVFGELIGLWCADTWHRMGRPDPVILAELGPGRGTLMADALRAIKVTPDFGKALRLHLVEISPALRQAQAGALKDPAPQWHDTIATLPDGPVIVVANEFLDALPIRQLMRGPEGWHERKVDVSEDGAALRFVIERKPDPGLAMLVPPGLAAKPGQVCEASPATITLAQTLGARLKAQGGSALFIDYGHSPSACGNTLQALRGHRRHEVLAEPGEADITAHVDFAAAARAAQAGGARAWGPVSQGSFLAALGVAERAAALLKRARPDQVAALESGVRRLIDPEQMGTLFKVLVLADPKLPAPAGFTKEFAA